MESNQSTDPSLEKPENYSLKEVPYTNGAVDFERLYRLHVRRIYRLCWHMVWDKSDADDLTQEVFVQVLRKINTFRGEAAFSTWLHRLAVNVVLMRVRRRSRSEPELGEGTVAGDRPVHAHKEVSAPDVAMAGMLDRLDLEQAMAQLPAGYRLIFVLHDVEGYGHGEIAELLGVQSGTSKSQLHKARLRLRDMLRTTMNPGIQGDSGNVSPSARQQTQGRRGLRQGHPSVLTPAGVFRRESVSKELQEAPKELPRPRDSAKREFELVELDLAETRRT